MNLSNDIWRIVFEYVREPLGIDPGPWPLRHVCKQFHSVATSLLWQKVDVHVDSCWRYEEVLASGILDAISKGYTSKEVLIKVKELIRPPFNTTSVRLGLKRAVRAQEYGFRNCFLNEIDRAIRNKNERKGITRALIPAFLMPQAPKKNDANKNWETVFGKRKLSSDILPFNLSDTASMHWRYIRHLNVNFYPSAPAEHEDSFNDYMFVLTRLVKASKLERIDIRFLGQQGRSYQSGMAMLVQLVKLLRNIEGLTVRLFVTILRAECQNALRAVVKEFERLAPRTSFALIMHEAHATPGQPPSGLEVQTKLSPILNQFLVSLTFKIPSITPQWLVDTVNGCPNMRHIRFFVPQKVEGQPSTIVLPLRIAFVELLWDEEADPNNSCTVIGVGVKRATLGGFAGQQLTLILFPGVDHLTLRHARYESEYDILRVGLRVLAETVGRVRVLETNSTQLQFVPLILDIINWTETVHVKLPRVPLDFRSRQMYYSRLAIICKTSDLQPRCVLEFFNDGPDAIVDEQDDDISDDEDYEEEGKPAVLREYRLKRNRQQQEAKQRCRVRQQELNAAKHVAQKFARSSNSSLLYFGHWFAGFGFLSDTEGSLVRLDALRGGSPGITYYRVTPRFTMRDLKNKDVLVEESFAMVHRYYNAL